MSTESETAARSFVERVTNNSAWVRLGLVALVLAIYAQCISFSLIPTWDDWHSLINRSTVSAWWSVPWSQRLLTPELGYPVPIPTAIWAFIGQWDVETAVPVAHGLNVGIQVANTLLAFELTRRWQGSVRVAAAVAALWTCHPLLVESVAWITNLKTVGLGAVFLATLLSWDVHLEKSTLSSSVPPTALALLCFGFRPEAAVLPAMMLLQTWIHDSANLRNVRFYLPLAIVTAATVAYVPVAIRGQFEVIDPAHQIDSLDLKTRLHLVGASLWLQISHVLYPVDLHPIYPILTDRNLLIFAVRGWLFSVPLLAALVWILSRSERPSRLFAALCLVTYAPASGFIYLPRGTADTYMYLPLLGIFGFAASVFAGRSWLEDRFRKTLFYVGVPALLVTFAMTSVLQAQRWSNPVRLWEPMIEAYPQYDKPYRSLGTAYFSAGEYERAVDVFKRGIEAMQRRNSIPLAYPRALIETGRIEEARFLLETIAKTQPSARDAAQKLIKKLPR